MMLFVTGSASNLQVELMATQFVYKRAAQFKKFYETITVEQVMSLPKSQLKKVMEHGKKIDG